MGTVTDLRPPRPRRIPQRDRALDARLVPGTVVEHPESVHREPPCLAVLVAKNVPNALGVVDEPGVHDWYVLSCGEQPECVGTIASFPTLEGAWVTRFDRDLLAAIRLAVAFVTVMRSWTHPGARQVVPA